MLLSSSHFKSHYERSRQKGKKEKIIFPRESALEKFLFCLSKKKLIKVNKKGKINNNEKKIEK